MAAAAAVLIRFLLSDARAKLRVSSARAPAILPL